MRAGQIAQSRLAGRCTKTNRRHARCQAVVLSGTPSAAAESGGLPVIETHTKVALPRSWKTSSEPGLEEEGTETISGGEASASGASAYSTGGGGVVLEHAYGGALLAELLLGGPVGGLGDDVTPTCIGFQQSAFSPVDDLMVTGGGPGGQRTLFIGVRRRPRVGVSQTPFVKLMVDYLQVISEHRAELDAGSWRLGLAVEAPHAPTDEISTLAYFARRQPDAVRFRAAVGAPHATTGRVRSRLVNVDEVVAVAAKKAGITLADESARDDLSWRVLKYLRILDLRLEGDDAVGRTSLVARLVSLTGDAAVADDLRRRLNELSAGYAIGSAVVTEETLQRDLFGTTQVRASRIRRIYERGPTPPETSAEAKPAYGRLVEWWDPVGLGVHPVIGGGPMPAYIRRPHDEVLRAVLDPEALASRLVVLRGGSSTGKSRAAYEAVATRLPDWHLDYPLDAGALAARLETGIPAQTVLWLGELRQYADVDGGPAVLGRLADLLQGEGHLIITTVWPAHWNSYIDAARAGPGPANPAETAGRLLERLPDLSGEDPSRIDPRRGGVIDVPDQFTDADLEGVVHADDLVLTSAAAAAASAGQDGQVTQYLAGVPDLLRRYAGPGGDPYGQAIITAAMDAARLGHAGPMPAASLLDAAVGYLTSPQRTASIEGWRDTALAWATEELNGAVQALQPVPPSAGIGVAGYQVTDYLDEHGRRTRQDQLGSPCLWDALTAHAGTASDLTRLAQSARDRGLFRHAAVLWTTAAGTGSAYAATRLITHLLQISPSDATRAARWAASLVSLDSPWDVAALLEAIHEAKADEATRILLARDPGGHARLDNPWGVARLVLRLREAGADDMVSALANRAATQASLEDPAGVARLLAMMRDARVPEAARTLLDRDLASNASVDDPARIAGLLWELPFVGHADAARALASRAAAQASLDDPGDVASLLRVLREAGASDALQVLLDRDPASHAGLSDPEDVAFLLQELRKAGADEAARTLTSRAADLDDPADIAWLLDALHEDGAIDAARALADLAAPRASLHDPGAIARLLRALRAVTADDAVQALLARDPVSHASLDSPLAAARLLEELGVAGASDAASALADRAAPQASLDDPVGVALLLQALRAAGAGGAIRALLDRDPVSHASLDDPVGVALLLQALRDAGADDAVRALLARDPFSHARLFDPLAAARLLEALRAARADDAASVLAERAAAQASFDNPGRLAWLMQALRAVGAGDAAHNLADRAANAGMFDYYLEVHPDQAPTYPFGREPDDSPSRSWVWQEPTRNASENWPSSDNSTTSYSALQVPLPTQQ